MSDVTVVDLVRNGTMSAEMAGVLWAAVDEQLSFLTVALPRLAGKTTTSHAILDLRRPEVPVHDVAGEPQVMERLQQAQLGGYITVAEFSRAPMYGYIWGNEVRRVFDTLPYGYALQTSLHADSVDEGIGVVTQGIGIPDDQVSAFKLVLYIKRFGDFGNYWRRVAEVFEVDRVTGGRPEGRTLFKWRQDDDTFEQLAEPRQFGDPADSTRRSTVIRELAEADRRSPEDVAEAVRAFHA